MPVFTDHEVCALTAPGSLNSAAGSLYVVATPIGNL
ncbi:MAG: 16S rRNA (cytidine(1402)-2'-O)-methyltransferase, partial [Pseudomonas sp.]